MRKQPRMASERRVDGDFNQAFDGENVCRRKLISWISQDTKDSDDETSEKIHDCFAPTTVRR